MKSFREFMVIVEDKMAERLSKMSASEFEQFLKGRSPGEAASFKAKRIKVPGSTFTNKGTQPQPEQPSGGTQQTKTPPKASQTPPPSSNPPKSSTPPPQPSGGSGGRGTPPPRPSSSTTTPSSGRRPNQYRGPGTGRTEIPRSTTNPGKDPGAFQTVKNNAKNIKNFKPSSVPGLKSGGVLSGVVDTAVEKSRGSGWLRSLAKGTASALGAVGGGIAGGAAGSLAGPVGTAVGGYAGQAAGATAAGKAFDTVAGKNAVQRAADREANRKRQSGGELKGIGGKTTFSKAKDGTGFMSTGSGSQRKTVQLAKTSVVKDPKTGKAETGYLAMKDGKAIYKRGANPGEGSSNAFERIGRTFNPNAYKANDAKLAAAKLKTAATSDIKRQQALGVKGSQNLVGPKIVGPQKPTPKPSAGIRSSGTSPGSIKIK